ncbi:pyridoxamine 5'-phosphate oxidase family protein [Lachnospiraceae bacterium 45-P1]
MRRKDRELTDMAEIFEIVKRETVCTVAFYDEPFPYLIPLNYGARVEEGKLVLYFHGAARGTKFELLKKNPRVSFSIFGRNKIKLVREYACKSSTSFESVCGSGNVKIIGEPEKKREGLAVIMNHIGAPEGVSYDEADFSEQETQAVTVWKITADTVTGKRHP